jgi:uncharacterized membrane protein
MVDSPTPKDRRDVFLWPLAHQARAQRYRCVYLPIQRYRLALCSRCLGYYPCFIVTVCCQLCLGWPLSQAWDELIVWGGSAPAVIDWGLGRLGARGHNAVRVASGLLLGLAMGRGFMLYLEQPRNEIFWLQLLLIGITALAFEIVRRLDLR